MDEEHPMPPTNVSMLNGVRKKVTYTIWVKVCASWQKLVKNGILEFF